jgi:uncharacterized membrane protein
MAWMGAWWVLAAAAFAFVLWAMLASTRGPMSGRTDSPERIAKKRYAQGEIDHDTFQQIMHDIKG